MKKVKNGENIQNQRYFVFSRVYKCFYSEKTLEQVVNILLNPIELSFSLFPSYFFIIDIQCVSYLLMNDLHQQRCVVIDFDTQNTLIYTQQSNFFAYIRQ